MNLGSFFGYTDFKRPILEIITWDFSTFTSAEEQNPGSIPVYYEKAGASQAGLLPMCTNKSYALTPQQALSRSAHRIHLHQEVQHPRQQAKSGRQR